MEAIFDERRRAQRFRLSIPVVVQDHQPDGRVVTGTIRDLSTSGLYFVVNGLAGLDGTLEFMLQFPPEMTNGDGVLVRAHGRAIRIEKHSRYQAGQFGVAVAIEGFDVVRVEHVLDYAVHPAVA